ncbi:MAG TPA: SDR family NAD(P)-dependent oxidoreductase [Flavobacterium sp.]|jgi:NADP-dependent 3-hydroxy acid dehydrogenase YdfG
MKTKIALVNGANKGIGFEIAKQLGHNGFPVILAGRDKVKIEDTVLLLQQQNYSVECGSGTSRSIAQGAETAVWLATKPDNNQTGKFFRHKKEINW